MVGAPVSSMMLHKLKFLGIVNTFKKFCCTKSIVQLIPLA
jgi:hypothetical protein